MTSRRAWLQLLGTAVLAACGTRRAPTAAPPLRQPLRVQVREGGRVRVLGLSVEEYVRGAILGEAAVRAADAHLALPVYALQAILARTYAAGHRGRHAAEGFDLCDQTHCQVFRRDDGAHPPWRRQAGDEAVARTAGQVITYRDHVIEAVFHAVCGGHTRNASAVWGGAPLPYLQGVPDPFCLTASNVAWSFRITTDALAEALNRQPATRIGRLTGIAATPDRDAGAPGLLRLEGSTPKTVRTEQVRVAINQVHAGAPVRSPSFSISRDGGVWVLQGRGNGHGVGVCQVGAVARIRAGARPEDVVAAYYPGTRVERLT